MADKTAQQKDVESVAEEIEESKSEDSPSLVDDDSKSENGDRPENGKPIEKENGEDEKETADDTDKVCSIKRKSTGGDAHTDTPAEGATPEKKAKLGETTEAESNGEAEVAA